MMAIRFANFSIRTIQWAAGILAATAITAGAAPVPLTTNTPIDPVRLRVDNPAVLSTSGNWRFELTHGEMVDGHFSHPPESASSSEAGNTASRAVDGNSATRWCADGESMPQWWQVDLGKTEQISGIKLAWEQGDGHYQYRVETGADEQHLKTVLDRTTAPGTGDGKADWPAVEGRFLRVTITSATDADGDAKWASIREAGITVIRDGKPVTWTPPSGSQTDKSADAFAAKNYNDTAWHEIPVPSNWEVLGYSRPTYFGPDNSVGLYRRMIDIPASFAGKRVLWHFDGVTDSAEVWVNGQRVGYHEGGFTAFDMDLTSAIKPGEKNLLAVRVCKTTPTVDLDTGDYWLLGGIQRESYLVALPTDHVDDVTLQTVLDNQYVNATLKADVKVVGTAGDAVSVTAQLFDGNLKAVDLPPLASAGKLGEDGSVTVHLQELVQNPKLWSAEKPNLYYLVLYLKQGDITESVQQRFGFRQVDIKDGTLLWNGVPIKCTGTCRHEEWSAIGHALTEHEWQTDIAMMKAANINAVRTSHYNHAERFLELCDEKGLYILDEIPACWVSNSDPKLKSAFVQHAVETLARDKNKPCVLAWSCGNESGWGPNFKAMVDYVKATDPTRPRFVSEISKSQDSALSISDHHYPGDASLRSITTTDAGPSVITEGPHIFYVIPAQAYDYGLNDLWGVALANQWARVWPSKPLFGAFVWEWQDQGLADKYPDKTNVDANGLRSENSKGIVTGFRVPKPEYYHVKMVYSPVTTDDREVLAHGSPAVWSATFANRYAFTDLSELICKWQAMTTTTGDRELAAGEVKLACPPGKSVTPSFPVTARADTLRVSFTNSNNVEVYAVRLHVAGAPLPAPPAALPATEKLQDISDAKTIGVQTSKFSVKIDSESGVVTISEGDAFHASGPTLNLGELRYDNGEFLNKNESPWIGSKQPPVLKNVKVIGGMSGESGWTGIVTADVTLAEAPDRVLAELKYQVTVDPQSHLDWSYHLKWLTTDMQAWEFGLKFSLPGDDRFAWYRKGQWTEYPAGHIGANQGSVTHEDRSFASTKRDTVWATVTTNDGNGLAVAQSEGALHTRCNFADGLTTLFASSVVSVDRDFSSSYADSTRIAFKQGRTYDGAFRMWLIAR